MLFMKLDGRAVMRSESGLASPKAQRFLIGNPLIMKDIGEACAGGRELRSSHGVGR